MTRLRLLFSLLFAAAIAATAHAARPAMVEKYQQSRQGPEQTERFSQSYDVGANGALDVQNLSGDVRVTTARGNAIQIDAVKRVRHRDPDDARRLLSQLRIEVTQAGNRVEVRTIYPRVSGRGLSASVDYVITVPTNASVSLKSISGDISVSQVRGEVRAETTSGDVDVTATPNLAIAKTVSGDVRARGVDAGRSVTLGTISGNVTASALDVRVLEAGTVSGDVQLTNVNVERLQARSTSGNIAFDSRLARGGRYELHAHSGNVRVMLSSAMGFELDASTFSGSVRSDFPITLRSPGVSQTGDRRGMNRAIRGTYGDASAILSLRSFSGNVVITKK